jgi:hypothetical protein
MIGFVYIIVTNVVNIRQEYFSLTLEYEPRTGLTYKLSCSEIWKKFSHHMLFYKILVNVYL